MKSSTLVLVAFLALNSHAQWATTNYVDTAINV